MCRAKKALVVAVVAALGLWGCAKGPGLGDNTRTLEVKVRKLEEDFKAAATARDQVRQKLAAVEEQGNKLQQQLARVIQERDGLRQQVVVRTSERDALQGQYDQFRKALRELVGQADTSAAGAATQQPVTAANPAAPPGKS
jgi:septal ring factor EnvC (AmiA/AmiB activator)